LETKVEPVSVLLPVVTDDEVAGVVLASVDELPLSP
jgi:hypothetical protein